jgi:hypothetical protein
LLVRKLLELMTKKLDLSDSKSDLFTGVKVYAVEIAGTVVFVVFIVVESIKAIIQLIGSIHKS